MEKVQRPIDGRFAKFVFQASSVIEHDDISLRIWSLATYLTGTDIARICCSPMGIWNFFRDYHAAIGNEASWWPFHDREVFLKF
jgi:hypothetical protein